MPYTKKEQKEYDANRIKNLKQYAYDSIITGKIINQKKWNMWCNTIKRKSIKYPYSDDFTNDIMFDMMKQGCFYCGDIAITIDRINSNLYHTPNNCVGSCYGCNISKGVTDPSTFIKKAYYRTHGNYYDNDVDIWFVYKTKPILTSYKFNASKQGVPFELIDEDWEKLIKNDCAYCKRKPITWFGIDKIMPSKGYVIENVVSCCYDCNLDKFEDNIDIMMIRNERIARRMINGELDVMKYNKVILHTGIVNKMSKKVCVYGNIYDSKSKASRALNKSISYIYRCIKDNIYPNDIFEITDTFYEEYKDYENITKNMFIAFEHFYINY